MLPPRLFAVLAAPCLLAAAHAAAASSTFYRCTDANGNTLYTNQKGGQRNCTVLSVVTPPAPSKSGASSAARTPTPAGFPKVAANEQQARDADRRSILETELANERKQLDSLRGQLAEAKKGAAAPSQALQDSVALHERNVEALTKEMAKLR